MYTHDYFGNGTNMVTHRSEGVLPGDATSWLYDEATELLVAKTYADGNGTSYAYTDTAENRPVQWECGTTNITMKFDRNGRRVEYLETSGVATNVHHRFVYDSHL